MGECEGMTPGGSGLSARDAGLLQIEGQWWRFPGAKEAAIREQLGMSEPAYYARLDRLIDQPAAAQEAPLLVARLRRRRALKRRRRAAGNASHVGAGSSSAVR